MQALISVIIAITVISFLIFAFTIPHHFAKAQEKVAEGLSTPTSIAFVGPGDILILEKDTGMVKRIVNGKVQANPVLDVNVANSVERCLCGIAVSKHGSTIFVFLYYTEIAGKDGGDKAGM